MTDIFACNFYGHLPESKCDIIEIKQRANNGQCAINVDNNSAAKVVGDVHTGQYERWIGY